MLLLIVAYFFKDKTLVMRIKNFEIRFCVIDLIFGLYCIKKGFKLYEGTSFFFDVYHFANSAKIRKNVIEAVMIVVLG